MFKNKYYEGLGEKITLSTLTKVDVIYECLNYFDKLINQRCFYYNVAGGLSGKNENVTTVLIC